MLPTTVGENGATNVVPKDGLLSTGKLLGDLATFVGAGDKPVTRHEIKSCIR